MGISVFLRCSSRSHHCQRCHGEAQNGSHHSDGKTKEEEEENRDKEISNKALLEDEERSKILSVK